MSAVLTPPDQKPAGSADAATEVSAQDGRHPLHAVETGEAPPNAPRPRATQPASTAGRGTRKYAILAALAAVLCLAALVAHKLRQVDATGLKDPVASQSGSAVSQPAEPSANAHPTIQAEPAEVQVATAATAELAASAAGAFSSTAASAPTAVGGPTAVPAPSVAALADAQASQVGINANLTSGLAQLQHDLADLKARVDGLISDQATKAAAPSATTPRVARLRPKPAAAPASAPVPTGTVLAVDLWDGQPSVVVGTGVPADKRVLFLREGDSKNGVTVKAANPAAQSALFDVNGREALLRADGRNE